MDERRIKPRWPINQGAQLTFENGVKPIPCVVEDINRQGMRVSLRRNLFDEVFSKFKLSLSSELEFNIGAQVVWKQESVEQNVYGLAFDQQNLPEQELFDRYINQNFHELVVKHWWQEPLSDIQS